MMNLVSTLLLRQSHLSTYLWKELLLDNLKHFKINLHTHPERRGEEWEEISDTYIWVEYGRKFGYSSRVWGRLKKMSDKKIFITLFLIFYCLVLHLNIFVSNFCVILLWHYKEIGPHKDQGLYELHLDYCGSYIYNLYHFLMFLSNLHLVIKVTFSK